ncbi:MAG: outer membrane beta-barrel protein [Chitinophagaceae bacterium]|nr:outer membrane beta-barrel protein [Chitinophagaceae bacterium]
MNYKKPVTFTLAGLLLCSTLFAQNDTIKIPPADTTKVLQNDTTKVPRTADTIRIGGMIIIKRGGNENKRQNTITIGNKRKQRHSNISTASWIVDLGFSNYADETDYPSATSEGYIINKPGSPALGENDFKLKTGKSVNVNIWVFMQRINLIKHYVNLKYGLGIELNNYRFKSNISFNEGGVNPHNPFQNIAHPFVFRDSIAFSKNKLAADYATIPFMINFITHPNSSKKGISLSAGVSAGLLYSSRNKQKSDERGKEKNRGDYDLQKWKFSYIAELGLGPARLYGSYSPKSIFENGLKMIPYNVGIRLSNW